MEFLFSIPVFPFFDLTFQVEAIASKLHGQKAEQEASVTSPVATKGCPVGSFRINGYSKCGITYPPGN